MTASGFAIVENGVILVRTVSPTKLAAIVNWLVVRKQVIPLDSWSDERVMQMWKDICGDSIIVPVSISLITDRDA